MTDESRVGQLGGPPRCPHCGYPMVLGTVLLGSPWICPKRGAHK